MALSSSHSSLGKMLLSGVPSLSCPLGGDNVLTQLVKIIIIIIISNSTLQAEKRSSGLRIIKAIVLYGRYGCCSDMCGIRLSAIRWKLKTFVHGEKFVRSVLLILNFFIHQIGLSP